jgi:hypothetical protein
MTSPGNNLKIIIPEIPPISPDSPRKDSDPAAVNGDYPDDAATAVNDSPGYAPDSGKSASVFESDSYSNNSWYGPEYIKEIESPDFILPEEDGTFYVESEHERDFSDYYDAIDNYYNYKSQYETAKRLEQTAIRTKNPTASWSKMRTLYKLKKPACINCKRRVGTVFSTEYVESDRALKPAPRILKAKCGDTVGPCALDIQIMIPNTTTFDNPIKTTKNIIKRLQNEIIREKNNAIFGYTSKEVAIQKFKSTTAVISSFIERYEKLMALYEYIANNVKKNAELTATQTAFYNNVDALNNYIDEFKRSNDDQYIEESVTLYIDELLLQSEQIMQSTYSYCGVDFEREDTTFHLIQQKLSLPKNQVSLRADAKIVKYVIEDQNVVYRKNQTANPKTGKTRLQIESDSYASSSGSSRGTLGLTSASSSVSEVSSD